MKKFLLMATILFVVICGSSAEESKLKEYTIGDISFKMPSEYVYVGDKYKENGKTFFYSYSYTLKELEKLDHLDLSYPLQRHKGEEFTEELIKELLKTDNFVLYRDFVYSVESSSYYREYRENMIIETFFSATADGILYPNRFYYTICVLQNNTVYYFRLVTMLPEIIKLEEIYPNLFEVKYNSLMFNGIDSREKFSKLLEKKDKKLPKELIDFRNAYETVLKTLK